MPTYKTPGVYFEWPKRERRPLSALRTDIAGFVGVAYRGPVHRPVRVDGTARFDEIFGPAIEQGHLAYAVHGFFANGGREAWIVRVVDPDSARVARWAIQIAPGLPACTLEAIGPGTWAQNLRIGVLPAGEHRFHLALRFGRGPDPREEFWSNLSTRRWLPGGDGKRSNPQYYARVLNGALGDPDWLAEDIKPPEGELARVENRGNGSRLVRVAAIQRPEGEWDPAISRPVRRISYGEDGLAALEPRHFDETGEDVSHSLGLAQLAWVDEVSMVAMPDIMTPTFVSPPAVAPAPFRCDDPCSPPRPPFFSTRVTPGPDAESRTAFSESEVIYLQQRLVIHCQKLKDRMAMLDAYPEQSDVQEAERWRNNFDAKFAAAYYPWVLVPDPLQTPGSLRTIPPSGHVAGVYARVSLRDGPHRPPANESLANVKDLAASVNDSEHGYLNMIGLNVLRSVDARGIRIQGARTVSSDAEWRFVNVRRLVTMIEETIEEQIQWATFEPHTDALRRDIDRVVRGFLDGLWQRGMLDGATEEEAYTVTCDETTNPPDEVEDGRLICEVGLNPPWPAEFIVVRIGLSTGGIEIQEGGGGNGDV